MKFLPFENIKILSPLSRESAIAKLENVVEAKQHFRLPWKPHRDYEGTIDGFTFDISRIVVYRHSFIPKIKGAIQAEANGCSIHLRMQLNSFVFAFMSFWLGCVGIGFLLMLGIFVWFVIKEGIQNPTALLMPGGMLVFGYLLTLIGFKLESVKSKKYFWELFQAKEVEEIGIANPFNPHKIAG